MGKHLGQHLLTSKNTAEKIVDTSLLDTNKNDFVLEIGPGKGMLTEKLLEKYKTVLCVEKDKSFFEYLENRFKDEILKKKLVLILSDVRDFDFNSVKVFKKLSSPFYRVVANIPYYITGNIIKTYLCLEHKPTSMTLLVQKEVAERISKDKKEIHIIFISKVF